MASRYNDPLWVTKKRPNGLFFLWSIGESNPWPQHCERCALPTELIPRGASGSRTRVQTRNVYAFYTLILAFIFVRRQDPSHQPTAYLLNLRHRIAACDTYSVYFRTALPFQPTDSAWSDVSFRHLVPEISKPTILRFKQRELQYCCQLVFEARFTSIASLLDVLT